MILFRWIVVLALILTSFHLMEGWIKITIAIAAIIFFLVTKEMVLTVMAFVLDLPFRLKLYLFRK